MNISAVEDMNVIEDIIGILDKYNIDEESKNDVNVFLQLLNEKIIIK